MIKKIWDFLGDIRVSFCLLLCGAACFFVGMLYNTFNYTYYRAMNEIRIQDWLARELQVRPGANWWLPLLIAILALLGINTVICTVNRLRELASGANKKQYRFIVALLPSIVHILFIAVMIGHGITLTMGSWTRTPISEGAELIIDPSLPPLTVTRIRDTYFPEGSRLAKRIMQTEVTLTDGGGREFSLTYLDSVRYHGFRLHLDMVKQKQGPAHQIKAAPVTQDSETCNRAETFRSKERKREPVQMIQLLVISDPGLPVIITGFTLILAVMTWYFIETMRKRSA